MGALPELPEDAPELPELEPLAPLEPPPDEDEAPPDVLPFTVPPQAAATTRTAGTPRRMKKELMPLTWDRALGVVTKSTGAL